MSAAPWLSRAKRQITSALSLSKNICGRYLNTGPLDKTRGTRNKWILCEVEAESVALLCCESLGLDGAEFCRGYIQNWLRRGSGLNADAIPEKSAQTIFRAADQIIRAGRADNHPVTA